MLSVHDSGTLAKTNVDFNPNSEGHSHSTLVISGDNKEDIVKKVPYRVTDNTDTLDKPVPVFTKVPESRTDNTDTMGESPSIFTKVPESRTDNTDTMEGISSLLSRWMKRSAQKKLTDGDRKVTSDSPILLPEHNKIYVKAPLTFPKGNVTQDSRDIIPVLDKQPPNVKYQFITNVNEAREALDELVVKGELVGLDLETTGLFCHEGAKARLLQVSAKEGPVLVMDLFQVGGLNALKEPLQKLKAVAHNAVFEMKFLKSEDVLLTLDCTLLANHVLTGEMAKLSDLCATHLNIPVDKTLQTSDWSGELTDNQLMYAAADASYTRLLFEKLMPLITEQGSEGVYKVCKEAQQLVVDMELTGMPFDAEAHKILLEKLTLERDGYKATLEKTVGKINFNSGKQLGEWITKILGGTTSSKFSKWPQTPTGKLATSEKDFRKSMKLLPMAEQALVKDFFLPYKTTEKQITSFGESLLKVISKSTGRIHASFKMAGTITGRFSCSKPNLQQIPRDKVFRSLFKAPDGKTFVIADYSQMELRVAALVTGETKLLQAYEEGKDIHALTASMLLNKKPEEISKDERQIAKAVNFGLLYGQGHKGLRDCAESKHGVTLSEEEAKTYREAWFKAYPGFALWHKRTAFQSYQSLSITTPLGRKRKFTFSKEVDTYTANKAYNMPIQGGAAEVMLAALGRLPNLLSGLDAKPIAVIHDEVIVETSLTDAPQVVKALEDAMVQGMLDVFPKASTLGLVDANIASTWAEK